MKKLVLILLVIGGLGAATVVALRRLQPEPAGLIRLSGNIELSQVDIAFKTAGRLVERAVDEGDTVRKGEVIARLDREQLLRQRQREQAGLEVAVAQLAAAETGLAWQKQALAAQDEARHAELSTAQSRLLELKNGSRPQEIEQAKAAVTAAQSEYERSKRDWERAQTLHKNDDISTAQYDQFRTRFESAEATLKQARERADLVVTGARSEEIEAASAQVMRARAAVKASEADRLDLKRREQEIVARKADSARAQAQIALIDSQLDETTVVSPITGVVLVKAADVGEVLAPGTTVVTVGDLDHPWLRCYVNERDLGKIKLGGKVRVTTDSFPGKTYEGRISFIASEAEFTPKQIQTTDERVKLVYRIKVDIDNPRHELKSNMPADAEIVLGS